LVFAQCADAESGVIPNEVRDPSLPGCGEKRACAMAVAGARV
jgi:hypothetical protein